MQRALESVPIGKQVQLPESTANEVFPHVSEFSKLMRPKQQHAVSIEAGEENSMVTPTSSDKKKLIFCFLGIFVSYFVYGLLQEKM